MAKGPSPEELGRRILSFFPRSKLMSRRHLLEKDLLAEWQRRGLRPEDLKLGLEYAVQAGWIIIAEGFFPEYILTEAGLEPK